MPRLPRIPAARSDRPGRSTWPGHALLVLSLALFLGGCDGDAILPAVPQLVFPVAGATLDTDRPTFAITNALGFDAGAATYTFIVVVASTGRDVSRVTVAAGAGETAVRFPEPLLRGATLAWSVVGRDAMGAEVSSGSASFRLPPVDCLSTKDPWAKSVVGFWVPAACLAVNTYSDPEEALGLPDAGELPGGAYFGFVSLGNGGFVDVDMEACAVDAEGNDVRVLQSVSNEPVTLYASSSPTGPWVLVESRRPCGQRNSGTYSRRCDFDLAEAGLEEARYLRVQDGELFPCPGGTNTEGADIDAVQILSVKP